MDNAYSIRELTLTLDGTESSNPGLAFGKPETTPLHHTCRVTKHGKNRVLMGPRPDVPFYIEYRSRALKSRSVLNSEPSFLRFLYYIEI